MSGCTMMSTMVFTNQDSQRRSLHLLVTVFLSSCKEKKRHTLIVRAELKKHTQRL